MKLFLKRAIRAMCWIVCWILPVDKKKVFVSNFCGQGFGDNPKYIISELLNSSMDIEIYWAISDESKLSTLPNNVKGVLCNSYSYIYHLTTAAIWIDNCRKEVRYKKKQQMYIQTWHGGAAGKKCDIFLRRGRFFGILGRIF